MNTHRIILLTTLMALVVSCNSVLPTPSVTPEPPSITPTIIPTSTPLPSLTPTRLPTRTQKPTTTATFTEPAPSTATPMATRVTTDNAIVIDDLGSFAISLTWSIDGNYLFIGTKDKGLIVYDVGKQKQLAALGDNLQIQSLAISPDGKTLAAGLANDGSIRLIAVETGELLQTIWPAHEDWVQAVAFSPDGKLLASGGDDGKLCIWDAATGELLQTLVKNGVGIWGLAFSPSGRSLVAGFQTDYTIRVWNTSTWTLVNTFEGDQAADLAFSPDGSKIVTAGGGIHEANLWDINTGKQLFNLREAPGWVWAVAYAPDGQLVASGGIGEVIILWNTASGIPVRELYTGPDFTQALAYNPNGSKLASAGERVLIWDMTSP